MIVYIKYLTIYLFFSKISLLYSRIMKNTAPLLTKCTKMIIIVTNPSPKCICYFLFFRNRNVEHPKGVL